MLFRRFSSFSACFFASATARSAISSAVNGRASSRAFAFAFAAAICFFVIYSGRVDVARGAASLVRPNECLFLVGLANPGIADEDPECRPESLVSPPNPKSTLPSLIFTPSRHSNRSASSLAPNARKSNPSSRAKSSATTSPRVLHSIVSGANTDTCGVAGVSSPVSSRSISIDTAITIARGRTHACVIVTVTARDRRRRASSSTRVVASRSGACASVT